MEDFFYWMAVIGGVIFTLYLVGFAIFITTTTLMKILFKRRVKAMLSSMEQYKGQFKGEQ